MTQESTNLLPGTRSIMHAILRLGPIWISIAPLYYVMSYVALASYLTPLNATWLASQFPITDVLIRGIGPFAFLLITGFLQEVHELRLSAKARKSSWAMAKFAWTVPILFVLGFWAVSALFPKTGLSIWFAVGAGCAMAAGQIGGAFVVRLEDRSFRWTWSSLLMAAFGLLLALVLAPIGFGMRDGIAITKGTTNLEKVIPKSSASLPYKTPLLLLLHSGGLFYVLDFQHDPSHPRVVVLRGEDVDWVGIP